MAARRVDRPRQTTNLANGMRANDRPPACPDIGIEARTEQPTCQDLTALQLHEFLNRPRMRSEHAAQLGAKLAESALFSGCFARCITSRMRFSRPCRG